jgi:hypothetical protein
MNDFTSIFPIRPHLVGVLWNFESITNWERRAGFFDHLFGFVEWIDRQSDDVGVLLLELVNVRLEIGYLPNAVRSPDAAVKDADGVFAP